MFMLNQQTRAPHAYVQSQTMNNYNVARMGTPRFRQQLITSYSHHNYGNVPENRDFRMIMPAPRPQSMQDRQNLQAPSKQVFQNTFQQEQQHFGYQHGNQNQKYASTSSPRSGTSNFAFKNTGTPAAQMLQVNAPKTSWDRNKCTSNAPFESVAQASSSTAQIASYNSTMQPVPKNVSVFSSSHFNPKYAVDTTNYSEMNNSYLTTNNNNNVQFPIYGSSDSEKTFIFTGTVERVIKWHTIFQNHFCHFEVFGAVVAIQEGTIRQQKIMLLRDKKGPILQIVYYASTRIDIVEFFVGKILRCVGTMSGQNIFNAISIRGATEMEVEVLQRMSLICDQAVSHYLNA